MNTIHHTPFNGYVERPFLTREQIKEKVPSIFGYKAENMSERYNFTPTHEIIDSMEKVGWYPTNISGVHPSKKDINTVKHVIRFADSQNTIKSLEGIVPEIAIINSHNGSSPLSAHLGFFRMVCANGLMVGTSISEMKWRHKKMDYVGIKEFIIQALEEFSSQATLVPLYQKVILSEKEKIQFAEKTINMVWNGVMFEPEKILSPKRSFDMKNDLWSVFNVIQENVTKGGIQYRLDNSKKHKYQTTKSIRNIDRNVNINLALWAMMDGFYRNGKF